MTVPLDLVAGVKELLRRASGVIADFDSSEESDAKDDVAVETAHKLLKAYIIGHEVAAKSPHYEAWVKATRGSGFFHGCLNRASGKLLNTEIRLRPAQVPRSYMLLRQALSAITKLIVRREQSGKQQLTRMLRSREKS